MTRAAGGPANDATGWMLCWVTWTIFLQPSWHYCVNVSNSGPREPPGTNSTWYFWIWKSIKYLAKSKRLILWHILFSVNGCSWRGKNPQITKHFCNNEMIVNVVRYVVTTSYLNPYQCSTGSLLPVSSFHSRAQSRAARLTGKQATKYNHSL